MGNITFRMDDSVKMQLQELLTGLGLDFTTFFTMTAKQAIRERGIPFKPSLNSGIYGPQAYAFAKKNTLYNNDGRAVISKDDEWVNESEWDEMFAQMTSDKELKCKKEKSGS